MVRTLPGTLSDLVYSLYSSIFHYIPGAVPWSVPSLVRFQIWYIPYIPLYSGIFRALCHGPYPPWMVFFGDLNIGGLFFMHFYGDLNIGGLFRVRDFLENNNNNPLSKSSHIFAYSQRVRFWTDELTDELTDEFK